MIIEKLGAEVKDLEIFKDYYKKYKKRKPSGFFPKILQA